MESAQTKKDRNRSPQGGILNWDKRVHLSGCYKRVAKCTLTVGRHILHAAKYRFKTRVNNLKGVYRMGLLPTKTWIRDTLTDSHR